MDKTLPHDAMTVYGKSQPDISIHKAEGGFVKGTTVVGASLSLQEEGNTEIRGGTIIERYPVHQKGFKSIEVTQTMANMVRLAGFLISKALEKGIIIEEINICGLSYVNLLYTIQVQNSFECTN